MTDVGASTRERILDAALVLASRKGAEGTSMRELADACDVNVAALYYHFPSKAELLRAVIEERHYDLMMGMVEVPPVTAGSDRDRLLDLILTVWEGMRGEEQVWRLLLAESCHHNPDAQDVARALVGRFEEVAVGWLDAGFDQLAVPVPAAARLWADFMFANVARVAIGATDGDAITDQAGHLATIITG